MSGIAKIKATLSSRLPGLQQAASVYAVIVLFVYGWTIYWFLWKLPSWLYFMTAPELLAVFSYSMVMNLLESLCVLLLPVGLSLLLSERWFRDQFVARGVSLSVVLLGFLMYYSNLIAQLAGLPSYLGWLLLGVFAAAVLIVVVVGKVGFLRRGLEEISERMIIFLYLSIPISAISLIVVMVRNLLA